MRTPFPGISLYTLALLFFSLLLPGQGLAQGEDGGNASEKPVVAVSILPQKYFVDRLAGDYVNCLVFVDRGGDPHTYEPTVSIMARAAKAAIYFTIGVPFESQWLDRFTDLNAGLRVVIPPITRQAQPDTVHPHEDAHAAHGHDHAAHAHDHAHGHDDAMHSDDPHIWLSPAAMREVVPSMRDALVALLPEHHDAITHNADALLADITHLEQEAAALFAPLPQDKRSFLTFHHAWGYYAQNFGLHEHSVEYMGKEPGPRGMAELVTLARDKSIRVIIVSPGTSGSSAKAVADNIHGAVIEADPLAEDWPGTIMRISRDLARELGANDAR